MARQWRLRSANGEAPHYQGGGRFSICIHHKGEFTVSRAGVREYAGGVVSYVDDVTLLSYSELDEMVKALGYTTVYYFNVYSELDEMVKALLKLN